MSWARVDDTFWKHPKVRSLIEAGEWQALALWVLGISYTNMKGSPELTTHEVAMLLKCSIEEGSRTASLLRSRGLFCFDSASQADVFHDWKKYRSKNEAKARAGAEGGRKSGETRRQGSEAKSKQGVDSASKQPRSPEPLPLPTPPDPNIDICRSEIDSKALTPNEGQPRERAWVTLDDFQTSVSGLQAHIGNGDRERFAKLHPLYQHELEHAIEQTNQQKRSRPLAYLFSVIEGERVRAAEIASSPKPPPAGPKPKTKEDRDLEEFLRRTAPKVAV